MAKTRHEIEEAKREWRRDPISYDLYELEGFEHHRDELKEYQEAFFADCEARERARLKDRASDLECSVALVKFIETLEYQIKVLNEAVEKLEG